MASILEYRKRLDVSAKLGVHESTSIRCWCARIILMHIIVAGVDSLHGECSLETPLWGVERQVDVDVVVEIDRAVAVGVASEPRLPRC